MSPIKFPTKHIFPNFHILKINRMMFCNLFMERPSYYYCHYLNDCYTIACVLQLATDTGRVCCVDAPLVLVIFRDGWILIFFVYWFCVSGTKHSHRTVFLLDTDCSIKLFSLLILSVVSQLKFKDLSLIVSYLSAIYDNR